MLKEFFLKSNEVQSIKPHRNEKGKYSVLAVGEALKAMFCLQD